MPGICDLSTADGFFRVKALNSFFNETRIYIILISILFIPFLGTISLDVIDIDSAQYAEIGREMVQDGNIFRLVDNGRRYLDKPILTFWTIAGSFSIFGISNLGFRIPVLLISLLSLFSLYHTSVLIWGSTRKALFACLFYLLAPGFYAMVVDPKIDIYLTSYLIFTFHFYYLGRKRNPAFYCFMYFLMSLGFITKGPISVVIPGIAIGGDILFRRDWKLLLSLRIPSGIFSLVSMPAIWCYLLFLEFHSYGPAFFLWIQSFGRFYKEMYNVKFDPFYFYKSFGWAFGSAIFPLILFSFAEVVKFFKEKSDSNFFTKLRTNAFASKDFVVPFWLFLFLFLISFSRYPLPQYVYWVLPGASLFFGNALDSILADPKKKWMLNGFYPIAFLYLIAFLVLPFESGLATSTYFVAMAITISVFLLFSKKVPSPILAICLSYFLLFGSISFYYYPFLVSFQPGKAFGEKIKELEPNESEIYTYHISHSKRSYPFYAERYRRSVYESKKIHEIFESSNQRLFILPSSANQEFLKMAGKGYVLETVLELDSYKVATPTYAFINPETRKSQTQKISLVWLKKLRGK